MTWCVLCVACSDSDKKTPAATEAVESSGEQPDEAAQKAAEAERLRKEQELLDREFPLHAAVTGTELRVYAKADLDAPVVGWLRVGSLVRLARKQDRGSGGCKGGGFHQVYPEGFVCADDGLSVRDKPIKLEEPSDEGWKTDQVQEAEARGVLVLPPPARDAPLPYDYYLVKDLIVPSYHRLPSRDEQRAAMAKVDHYMTLLEKDEKRARAYLRGESDQGPSGTAVAAQYLDRGFFVASNGSEVRAFRRFVRTSQGRYIKQAQLEAMEASTFKGVELGKERSLPIAWATRPATPMLARERSDGSVAWIDDTEQAAFERHDLLSGFQGQRRVDGRIYHRVQTKVGPRYLKSWFASVAYPLPRPREVPPGQPWVHVDKRQQVAVLYQGDRALYATLVSTGVEGHETPVGVFQIRQKRVTDTMADLGPEAGDDRYRVEDVPWTQYFEGSVALHAAFWHNRFGIPRSHGCVNMSPADAHRFFGTTLPRVPSGWHGVSTDGTALNGSYVVVTDEDLSIVTNGLADRATEDEPKAQGVAEVLDDNTKAEAESSNEEQAQREPDGRGVQANAKSLERWQARMPAEVFYTVHSGGTARFVANLYELPHHVLQALNPELDLDKELKPGTKFLIYQYDPKVDSRSIGSPERGKVAGAVPLPEGEGRIIKATPAKTWATRRTVGLLDAVLRAWPKLEPHGDPLLVGNMSRRRGGKLPPHHTHQSGRDVDLGYPQVRNPNETYNWRDMSAANLDSRRTWRLLHLLKATGELERVFIDRSLQKVLYDYAIEHNVLSKADLATWLEYPRAPGDGAPIVQHVPGHVDHLHVRFSCGGQSGCE